MDIVTRIRTVSPEEVWRWDAKQRQCLRLMVRALKCGDKAAFNVFRTEREYHL